MLEAGPVLGFGCCIDYIYYTCEPVFYTSSPRSSLHSFSKTRDVQEKLSSKSYSHLPLNLLCLFYKISIDQ